MKNLLSQKKNFVNYLVISLAQCGKVLQNAITQKKKSGNQFFSNFFSKKRWFHGKKCWFFRKNRDRVL